MNRKNEKDQINKRQVEEVKTFTVPIPLEVIEEQDTIIPSSLSKEQIINQALKFHSQKKISEASKYYQYCLKNGFNDYRVFSNYGIILKSIGKMQDAEIYTNRAIELNPNFATSHYNLAVILSDLGKLQQAVVSYRKAIELKPDFVKAHSNLGSVLSDLGQLQQAEVSYRKAIELKPDFGKAHYNLGNILRDQGKLKGAENAYKKIIEFKPDFINAHLNLGNIFKELGKLEEAEKSYKKVIKLKPDSYQAHLNLGNIFKELDKLEEAENSYKKVIELKPDLAGAYSNLGLLFLRKNLYDLSLQYFSKSSIIFRVHNNQETNNPCFRNISKAKIDHDIEQLEYLISQEVEIEKFSKITSLYKKVSSEINWTSDSQVISLSNKHYALLRDFYNRLIYQVEVPKSLKEVVNKSLSVEKISDDYFQHEFGLTYIDNFLSPKALESFRKFLLGSTIWFDVKAGGYLGAYLTDGLANPLIIQIAEELRKKFPRIFKDYPINQIWAYKYDSRSKNEKSSLSGINVHADFAAVNVNFWITPSEANLNPDSGGLIVYDVEAPKEWDFKSFNNNVKKIREELKKSKGNTKIIPYNENRAVIFNSNLFHETDNYEFKEGYENRRINVTMLFGNRN